jgi:hypothetical protein
MTEKVTPKVTFMPGCFDSFEGTQEELDDLIKQITEMAESGELNDDNPNVRTVFLDDENDEIDEILDQINPRDFPRTLQ